MKQTHKCCKDCGKRKPVSKYYASKRSNGKTYYGSYCKVCAVARSRSNEVKTYTENYERLWDYFMTHPCVDCGEDNPIKLSLDHRDEKNHDISNMMKKKWHRIVKELKLCDVRCHNCHAVKTAAQFNHYVTPSLRDYVMQWPDNRKAYRKYAK